MPVQNILCCAVSGETRTKFLTPLHCCNVAALIPACVILWHAEPITRVRGAAAFHRVTECASHLFRPRGMPAVASYPHSCHDHCPAASTHSMCAHSAHVLSVRLQRHLVYGPDLRLPGSALSIFDLLSDLLSSRQGVGGRLEPYDSQYRKQFTSPPHSRVPQPSYGDPSAATPSRRTGACLYRTKAHRTFLCF